MLRQIINELIEKYPEQKTLIWDILNDAEYLRDTASDKQEAISVIHSLIFDINTLWDAVYMENLNDRNLSDKDFSKAITDIKYLISKLDSLIDDYKQDAIAYYDLYIG